MLVVAAGRKLDEFFGGSFSRGLTGLVFETDDRVRIGNVEPVLMKRHPERLRKLVGKDEPFLGNTVLVLIAKNMDRIRTRIGQENVAVRCECHPAGLTE